LNFQENCLTFNISKRKVHGTAIPSLSWPWQVRVGAGISSPNAPSGAIGLLKKMQRKLFSIELPLYDASDLFTCLAQKHSVSEYNNLFG
jgi:hypothetical protein